MIKQTKVLNEWNRERTLFPRNSKGQLLAKKVPILGMFNKTILMIPKTIGECDEINLSVDMNLIKSKQLKKMVFDDCLILPKIKNFSLIRPPKLSKIYHTLLFESGYDMNIERIKNETKQRKHNTSSDRLKVYKLIKANKDKAKYDYLLHEAGYTMFNIPKLTRCEADLILQSSNEIQKKRNLTKK